MHVFVAGASGRLGQSICEILESGDHKVTRLSRNGVSELGELLREPMQHGKSGPVQRAEATFLVDVSVAEGTLALCKQLLQEQHTELASLHGIVIGTTGHGSALDEYLPRLAQILPVVLASNFSKGVFLFEEILRAQTSSGLSVCDLARSLGFELGLIESHHSKKRDAPSGTAITLAKAGQLNVDGIASLRLGSIIGEHTLVASADAEELRITHTAQNRKLFALGAVSLLEKMASICLKPDLYSVRDVFRA